MTAGSRKAKKRQNAAAAAAEAGASPAAASDAPGGADAEPEAAVASSASTSAPAAAAPAAAEVCTATAEESGDAGAPEVDLVEEAVSSYCPPARPSGDAPRISALEDPALQAPAESKADWAEEMEKLAAMLKDASVADDEKVRLLNEALTQRIEDTRSKEEHKAKLVVRLDDTTKELDRLRQDASRAVSAKTKLEATCRELQSSKLSIDKENARLRQEEEARHTELKEKFQVAIKDVQEKMDAELEVRQHFLKENEDLRGKLLKFTETYEAQEQQLAEQRESREAEMEVARQRLKEHEVMCSESKTKTAMLEKQNETLRKSQTVLRNELQAILGKFDEFHQAVTGSNTRHGECKEEIDGLQGHLAELERTNQDLRECAALNELTSEHQVAQKQRDALDKLCSNLEKENRKHRDQVTKLRKSAGK
eukprot:TRINITY_DN74491_c0_g1_i1.p1 TRINITY_DN74491_c0_g1~~TRINITY_DN74491_c0_g1_i1.p1  ORF type:complete len:424 (+),score=150.65 TRINITY_DN74491_c0_g1_i1:98-1369(+)